MILSKLQQVDKDRNPIGSDAYWFWCPGCDAAHQYVVGAGDGPRWTFNGDMDKPTFTPSLLNTAPECRCHLFVTGGRIVYCSDCGHALAGQTVDMVEVPEWLT